MTGQMNRQGNAMLGCTDKKALLLFTNFLMKTHSRSAICNRWSEFLYNFFASSEAGK